MSQYVSSKDTGYSKLSAAEISYLKSFLDAGEDERMGLVHPARIRLDQTEIDRGDKVVVLSAGLSVTADVRTGQRSVMSYLLGPIDKARREAGRER
jgi:multidrug efflux pump subunit AcrA (membrane-fusion protein)